MAVYLSIVIPVYNAEKTLQRCVDSILRQHFTDYEVWLINDGSQDCSAALCDEYAQKHSNIHVIHQQNQGVSVARNQGIEHAQGEYLLFVDSDDYLDSAAFNIFRNSPILPDLTIWGSVMHQQGSEDRLLTPQAGTISDREQMYNRLVRLANEEELGYDYLGVTWNKILKASIIHEHHIRFMEGLSYYEDEIFALHYAAHCQSLMVCPSISYHYEQLSNGLTQRKRPWVVYKLLSNAYRNCLPMFENEALLEYLKSQELYNLFVAIKQCYVLSVRNEMIKTLHAELKLYPSLYSVLRKTSYKFIMKNTFPELMQLYCFIRALFSNKK